VEHRATDYPSNITHDFLAVNHGKGQKEPRDFCRCCPFSSAAQQGGGEAHSGAVTPLLVLADRAIHLWPIEFINRVQKSRHPPG